MNKIRQHVNNNKSHNEQSLMVIGVIVIICTTTFDFISNLENYFFICVLESKHTHKLPPHAHMNTKAHTHEIKLLG